MNLFLNEKIWNRISRTIFSITLQIYSFFISTKIIMKELDKNENSFRVLKLFGNEIEIPTAMLQFGLLVLCNILIIFGSEILTSWKDKKNDN